MATFTTTLASIRDFARNILGEPPNSGVYTDDFLNQLANQEQKRIFREYRWTFAEKTFLKVSYQDTLLETAITTASTTLEITTESGYPSSGAVYSRGDVIDYTGITTGDPDILTGVTGIGLATAAGATIKPLYELPSDFSQFLSVLVNQYRVGHLNYQEFKKEEYFVISQNENPKFYYPSNTYTVINDTNNQKKYLLFANSYGSSERIEGQYYISPAEMTDSVNCSLPDEFALKVLAPLVAGLAAQYRGDPDGLAGGILARGQFELDKMKEAYFKENESFMQTVRTNANKRITRY